MAALQRKIDNILRGWVANKDKKPLVIKGYRHIGQSGHMTILPLYMAFLLDKP